MPNKINFINILSWVTFPKPGTTITISDKIRIPHKVWIGMAHLWKTRIISWYDKWLYEVWIWLTTRALVCYRITPSFILFFNICITFQNRDSRCTIYELISVNIIIITDRNVFFFNICKYIWTISCLHCEIFPNVSRSICFYHNGTNCVSSPIIKFVCEKNMKHEFDSHLLYICTIWFCRRSINTCVYKFCASLLPYALILVHECKVITRCLTAR